MAHKAEHAVDLETGAIVGVTVQDADGGDTTTSRDQNFTTPLTGGMTSGSMSRASRAGKTATP